MAEELSVPFERVSRIFEDTDVVPNRGMTPGTTIGAVANARKQAAASARQLLLSLAAEELGADISASAVRDGVVRAKGNRLVQISYGTLVGDRQFGQVFDADAPVKTPADYRIVGQSVPHIDIARKLTACAGDFQENARVPGMQFARTPRPRLWSHDQDRRASRYCDAPRGRRAALPLPGRSRP